MYYNHYCVVNSGSGTLRGKKRAVMVMVTAPSLINYINGECKNAAKIHVKLVDIDLIIDLMYTF